MYKFKPNISTTERAEVMKIVKYDSEGLVYHSSLEAHPELKVYFEAA